MSKMRNTMESFSKKDKLFVLDEGCSPLRLRFSHAELQCSERQELLAIAGKMAFISETLFKRQKTLSVGGGISLSNYAFSRYE